MKRTWDDYTLYEHARFIVGMLVVGVLTSLATILAGAEAGAAAPACAFSGRAAGSLWQLMKRLRATE